MPPRTTTLFRRRLRAARELRGLNQTDLAQRSGLQQSAVSHYETGTRRPSFTNLRKLAEAMDVTADYLIGRTDTPEGVNTSDEPLFRDFARLSVADRELARQLVANLAKRGRPSPRSRS